MDGKGNVVGLDRDLGVRSVSLLVVLADGFVPEKGSIGGRVTPEPDDVENHKVGGEADRRLAFVVGNYLGVERHARTQQNAKRRNSDSETAAAIAAAKRQQQQRSGNSGTGNRSIDQSSIPKSFVYDVSILRGIFFLITYDVFSDIVLFLKQKKSKKHCCFQQQRVSDSTKLFL